MPACPAGHDSSATDFCDVCGMRIGGVAASPASPASAAVQAAPARAVPAEPCPQCGTERTGQFCEGCGFDFRSGTPASAAAQPGTTTALDPASAAATGSGQATAPASSPAAGHGPAWTAVVTADRGYYDRVIAAGGPDASSIEFPAYCPERRFPLSGQEMRVGRRSVSRGLEPEIDLSGPPADPGVSHLHAVLVAQPGGGWSLLDPGSSNGTQVNGVDIQTGVAVALQPGDQICMGAWTVLTIQA